MIENLYATLAALLAADETVAVATVVDARGSTPREVGAKMIIRPQGEHIGTVGGGGGEAVVIRAALDTVRSSQPVLVHIDLSDGVDPQSMGACGGAMDVFVERFAGTPRLKISEGHLSDSDLIAALLAALHARQPCALVTVVSGPSIGRRALVPPEGDPLGTLGLGDLEPVAIAEAREALRSRQHRMLRYRRIASRWRQVPDRPAIDGSPEPDRLLFVEAPQRTPDLIIVGAGHISVPLAKIASLCDFSVTVLDDRADFVTGRRFPAASRLLVGPLPETLRDLEMDRDTFLVLVTRGHEHDVSCLTEIIDRPLAYIGMIGSQRRVATTLHLLSESGRFDAALADRIYAPIGIAIGARTPAEIAVCITAELINVRRAGPAVSLSDHRRRGHPAAARSCAGHGV